MHTEGRWFQSVIFAQHLQQSSCDWVSGFNCIPSRLRPGWYCLRSDQTDKEEPLTVWCECSPDRLFIARERYSALNKLRLNLWTVLYCGFDWNSLTKTLKVNDTQQACSVLLAMFSCGVNFLALMAHSIVPKDRPYPFPTDLCKFQNLCISQPALFFVSVLKAHCLFVFPLQLLKATP